MSPGSLERAGLLAIAGLGVVVIFLTTERCFDAADLKSAQQMVETLRAHPGAPTIPEAIARAHPSAGPIEWRAALRDKFYGFVHVTGVVPVDGKPVVYEFDVNLAGQRLHPGNDAARRLLKEIGER